MAASVEGLYRQQIMIQCASSQCKLRMINEKIAPVNILHMTICVGHSVMLTSHVCIAFIVSPVVFNSVNTAVVCLRPSR